MELEARTHAVQLGSTSAMPCMCLHLLMPAWSSVVDLHGGVRWLQGVQLRGQLNAAVGAANLAPTIFC